MLDNNTSSSVFSGEETVVLFIGLSIVLLGGYIINKYSQLIEKIRKETTLLTLLRKIDIMLSLIETERHCSYHFLFMVLISANH